MSEAAQAMTNSVIAIAILMVATWIVSLVLKNASIVDIVWGLGFVMVAWVVRLSVDGNDDRQRLLTAMVTLWGARLGFYLLRRNAGHGEDYRYKAMRRRWGARFPMISLVTVFALQAVLMWVVSLPVQIGQTDVDPGLGAIAGVGVVLWAVGLFFEAVGDQQLAAFKADPVNKGKVMDKGLWRYTRHPNYFGDACVWWGIGLVAVETGSAWWTLIGPILMTTLLLKVSGVALLEKSLMKRREGYAEYVRRTSAFIPRPLRP